MKENRRQVHNYYNEVFSNRADIRCLKSIDECDPMWHLYPIFVKNKIEVFQRLREKGVGVQVNYVPANQHPVFSKLKIDPSLLRNSDKFYKEEISLPIYSGLTRESQHFIVKAVLESL